MILKWRQKLIFLMNFWWPYFNEIRSFWIAIGLKIYQSNQKLSAADAAVTVTILAERPETLDLMRRNIDQLTRDFQQMGYDSITFSFGERQGDGNEQGHSGAFAKDEAANNASNDTASPASLSQAPLQATSGLDLRM